MTDQYEVYLSGKMRGLPEFGFPIFDKAQEIIERTRGWKVVSPANMDREIGFNEKTGNDYDFDVNGAMRRDFTYLVTNAQGIVLIRQNWRVSHGARSELIVAQDIGLDLWEVDLDTEEIRPLKARVATHLDVA
jgi:hypothetical protein